MKVQYFDTNEVIEEESQAVLNTLTEHKFQDAFRKMAKSWERYILAKGPTLRAMVANNAKVNF
jgi:hypothetical protein